MIISHYLLVRLSVSPQSFLPHSKRDVEILRIVDSIQQLIIWMMRVVMDTVLKVNLEMDMGVLEVEILVVELVDHVHYLLEVAVLKKFKKIGNIILLDFLIVLMYTLLELF
jgi:hypothetical protein